MVIHPIPHSKTEKVQELRGKAALSHRMVRGTAKRKASRPEMTGMPTES